jgi:hypothetical protein
MVYYRTHSLGFSDCIGQGDLISPPYLVLAPFPALAGLDIVVDIPGTFSTRQHMKHEATRTLDPIFRDAGLLPPGRLYDLLNCFDIRWEQPV